MTLRPAEDAARQCGRFAGFPAAQPPAHLDANLTPTLPHVRNPGFVRRLMHKQRKNRIPAMDLGAACRVVAPHLGLRYPWSSFDSSIHCTMLANDPTCRAQVAFLVRSLRYRCVRHRTMALRNRSPAGSRRCAGAPSGGPPPGPPRTARTLLRRSPPTTPARPRSPPCVCAESLWSDQTLPSHVSGRMLRRTPDDIASYA